MCESEPSWEDDPDDSYTLDREPEIRPAVDMPLMVPVGTHVRICGLQMQQPKAVVDVDLSKLSIARQAKCKPASCPWTPILRAWRKDLG